MPTDPEGFANNWAYLKTELRWLDQVLMLAVSRQRKENQEVERVAHSKADRATSSWWKGIIFTEGKAAYDEHRKNAQSGDSKVNYHQQLETRIQATSQKGIVLALPALRDRLGLTQFEKNLVLMSLAPEINRKYARLYHYLQGDDLSVKTNLPTLDLVLRLLCRNDEEWRSARQRLISSSPLIQHELLLFSPETTDSSLGCPLKLATPLVNYLLAEQPTTETLETLVREAGGREPQGRDDPQGQPISPSGSKSVELRQTVSTHAWTDLVLPQSLIAALRYLAQRVQGHATLEAKWGIQPDLVVPKGTIALLTGAPGTGKTLAAETIAHSLNTALHSIDLATVDPIDYAALLQTILTTAPKVLLLKSARLWFGRTGWLSDATTHQFFDQRRQLAGVTLLSDRQPTAVQLQWRQHLDQVLPFPMPNANDRGLLWQQAFPPQIPLSPNLDWKALADQLPLTGGAIKTLAHEAILYAATCDASHLDMSHIAHVLMQHGKTLKLASLPSPVKTLPKSRKSAKPQQTTARSSQSSRQTKLNKSTPNKSTAKKPAKSADSKIDDSSEPVPEIVAEIDIEPVVDAIADPPEPPSTLESANFHAKKRRQKHV